MAGKEKETTSPETVLILQGGGSLGAYECGVWKTLARHNIKFEIIAGTSIGAVNAAIIAAHKGSNNSEVDNEDSAKMLENFWLELAENIMPPLPLPQQFSSTYSTDEMRAVFASMYSAIYGNPKAFFPQWIVSSFFNYYFQPFKPLAYPLFDITPLKKTLSRYVDFDIFKTSKKRPRLIVTCTNIQTSNPAIQSYMIARMLILMQKMLLQVQVSLSMVSRGLNRITSIYGMVLCLVILRYAR
ncbi:MAG: patatin-like phospholipase family protein [Candidatus Nitrosopolaris sp.]